MKLSKANEETLKGIAALLKKLKSDDIVIMTSGTSYANEEASKMVVALDKDLRRLRANLKDMPEPVTVQSSEPENPCAEVAKSIVIDLAYESLKQIQDTYVETFGPLDPNIMSNDIQYHVIEIIKAADPKKVETIEAQVGQIESEFEETPVGYANPSQLTIKSALVGMKYDGPDTIRSLPLYRKKS
jgi:hypothetical protein